MLVVTRVYRTKGGTGGATTTVSTVPEFSAAVSGSTPKIIIVKGDLVGEGKVDVGSFKTIIGAKGSCKTKSPKPYVCH